METEIYVNLLNVVRSVLIVNGHTHLAQGLDWQIEMTRKHGYDPDLSQFCALRAIELCIGSYHDALNDAISVESGSPEWYRFHDVANGYAEKVKKIAQLL